MSQENNFIPSQEPYKQLSAFHLFVKSNFPFIESTYEALDNYGLYCKVVEYLNNVISNENTVESNVQALYDAFVSLNTYVSDYFDNLDVQEEINNKLDEMAENGTLTNLIKRYIDPIYQEYENNINNRLDEQDAEIQAVASGSPLVASSTSEMTDTSRVYVNTTDGKWYFYNGTSWEIGGTYQATEDSSTVNNLVDDVNDIKYELTTKFGNVKFNKTYLYNEDVSGEIPSTNFANTRRWFFNKIFNKGDVLKTIKFKNYRNTAQTITFEIWIKENNTLSKVETITQNVTSQQIYETDINYTGTNNFLLAFIQTTGTVCYDEESGNWILASSDTSSETDSLNYTTLTPFVGLKPSVSIKYIETGRDNVILIGESQTYTEIQDALDAITDDNINNPYTLILMPKKEPYQRFSMIRHLYDPYPWSNAVPRYISIIGIDKSHCIVESDTGNYTTPCGEVLTNGIIKDITFKMTHDNQDVTATQGGYCLHIDSRTLNDVGYNMTIENCNFENDSGPCLGIGLHENCNLTIKNCHLNTTLLASYQPYDGYRNLVDYGVIFAHTSTLSNAQNQKLKIENCIGICKEGLRSLWISSAGEYSPTTADFEYTIVQNVFWNNELNSNGYDINSNLTANPINFGNNN